MWPFSRKARRQLGVDVGTSSVKIVELERENEHLKLANYGIISGSDFFGETLSGSSTPLGLKMSENDVAGVLKRLLASANIKARSAVMSIPIFSSFLTVMELPNLSAKELESAVPFEARSYIPVPLAEVVLDWLIIPTESSGAAAAEQKKEKITVLLIAVPKEVISKYQRIAAAAGLALAALESESFSLARSLVGSDKGAVMLIDMGDRSANLTVINQGFILISHSADISGREITKAVAHGLNVIPARAEELKRMSGVAQTAAEKGLAQVITPFIDKLVGEIERMDNLLNKKISKKIEKIILTGGTANLPGMTEYISRRLGVEIIIGNSLGQIKFNPELERIFRRELSPVLAVAVGLAMREL